VKIIVFPARKRKKHEEIAICRIFPEIWGNSPCRLQTHQTTNRDPEPIHISRKLQTYCISEICQTYFRNLSDPESNQYWGIRKHQKIIQK
jgi:hypothetical protein